MIDITTVFSDFARKEIHLTLLQEIKSGKEATIYKVSWNNEPYALKIYKDSMHISFNRFNDYRAGKYIQRASDRKALAKKNAYGRKLLESSRTALEYKMLNKFYEQGAYVPRVYAQTQNAILMEYLGDEKQAAPKIKDVKLSQKDAERAFKQVMASIEVFYNNGIIHGDLSEFNILWWHNEPYIIDFPQAIDIRTNPNAETFLQRDVENVKKYFGRLGIENI